AAGDNRAVGRAWYVRATSAFTRGDYDTAERAFRQALLCFESSSAPSPELPYVWRGLARVAQFRGDYAEAETRYRRHLALAVEAGSEHDVIDAHIAISGIYLALRDYAGAEAMAAQAVEQSRAYPRSMFLARAQI